MLLGGALVLHEHERSQALGLWLLESHTRSEAVASRYQDLFRSMYEGLRTIARLPSVRRLDRSSELDDDARATAQEIYNNLAATVAMSEVYIVPIDFDPDARDPITGAAQEPLETFDELIVGRIAGASAANREHHDGDDEELELYEYRQMQAQLEQFRALCPHEDRVDRLEYPALCSSEVRTCDNRFYSPSAPDEADRSGLVYSVPLFGPDGALRGCVSGVLLTRVLREALPHSGFAVRSNPHRFTAPPLQDGLWRQHVAAIDAGLPAEGLLYSRILPLRIRDANGGWVLWAARADEEFESSLAALQARRTLWTAVLGIIALTTGVWFAMRTLGARRAHERLRARELERARDMALELSRAKAKFVAVASHEIRTPMNGVLGMTELLLQGDLPAEQRALAETAQQSARTLVELLQGILDYSRIDAGKLELETLDFDPVTTLEDAVQLLAPVAAQKDLQLALHLDPELPRAARGDPLRLRQVLTNLLGNAIKFTPAGRVTVQVARADDRRPLHLVVRVIDTGIGLDPELQQRLFEPFSQADSSTTRRFGGSGLGLAICRGLVSAMGGSIGYRPTPGAGTTFEFDVQLLPAAESQVTPRPLADHRVLIAVADDEQAAAIAAMLQLLGADSARCRPGADAAARWSAPAAEPCHALLTESSGAGAGVPDWIAALPQRPTPVILLESWTRRRGAALGNDVHSLLTPPRTGRLTAAVQACRQAPAAPTERLPAPIVSGDRPRVLIVDDNEVNLRVARLFLSRMGYDCDNAHDGQEAIDRVAAGRYDLVLMDWQMPVIDGVEAARRIRAGELETGRARVPIIAVTANAMAEDQETCIAAGMDGFLSKPLNSRQLAATLAQLGHTAPAHPG
ncbi:MAG: ATP-binding protein [Planctomycetota bacterium]